MFSETFPGPKLLFVKKKKAGTPEKVSSCDQWAYKNDPL
jgi:hypothetical protein